MYCVWNALIKRATFPTYRHTIDIRSGGRCKTWIFGCRHRGRLRRWFSIDYDKHHDGVYFGRTHPAGSVSIDGQLLYCAAGGPVWKNTKISADTGPNSKNAWVSVHRPRSVGGLPGIMWTRAARVRQWVTRPLYFYSDAAAILTHVKFIVEGAEIDKATHFGQLDWRRLTIKVVNSVRK